MMIRIGSHLTWEMLGFLRNASPVQNTLLMFVTGCISLLVKIPECCCFVNLKMGGKGIIRLKCGGLFFFLFLSIFFPFL